MNHVWTSIAFRLPCATQQTRSRPILELFNGYARRQSTRRTGSKGIAEIYAPRPSSHVKACKERDQIQWPSRHAFSTSAVLHRRNRAAPPTLKAPTEPAQLQPAQTVAAHTEGLPLDSEELSWRDYDPEGGMPLPDGERNQAQINGIFGNEDLDAANGNYILSVMYWRRMSGALIDVGLEFPRRREVSREQALKGLEYVRSLYPEFDEQAAGQVWVEEETLRQREALQERALKLKLYKRDEEVDVEQEEIEEEVPEEQQQGTAYGRSRTGESQLSRIRAENEAKAAEREAAKADSEAKAELAAMHTHRGPLELGGGVQPSVDLITYTGRDGISISRPKTTAWLESVERKPWVKYYEERAHIIKENSIPQLSTLRRLGPSFLLLLAVLSLAIYTSNNYTPPPSSARLWPDMSPTVATLTALTAALTLGFVLTRFPPFWRTSSKFLCIVPAYPYSISLLGSPFRHDSLAHLGTNLASLWLFGMMLHDVVDRGSFLSIFFASAAFGGFTSLAWNVATRQWGAYIFGSSNAVLGVVAAACTLRPNGSIRVWGQEVPIAAWMFLAVWGGLEVLAVWRFKRLGVDHAGHVGGLVSGFGWGMWMRERERRGREEEAGLVERVVEVE